MTSQVRRRPFVLNEENGWIHRDFLKEKLRVRERYWHFASNAKLALSEGFWVIPDGVAWRKYLPLLSHLVDNNVCKLILLESAADLMDYRNMSPCVSSPEGDGTLLQEAAAPQERSKIQKLIHNFPRNVIPFCDLSIREEDHDEWDMMGYSNMSIVERSNHSLIRAGRILQTCISEEASEVTILSTCTDFVSQFPSEDGIDLATMDQLIEKFVTKGILDNAEQLVEMFSRCDDDYRLRNFPSKSMSSTNQEYLSEDQILSGLKNKTLARGRLMVTKENPKEGFVVVASGDSYFINQYSGHYNRSLHHDIVIVQELDQCEWGRPVGKRRLVHHRDDDDDKIAGPTNEMDMSPAVPSARVVAISEASRRQYVATMVDIPMNNESACLVIPMDVRIPKIRIKTSGWRRFVGHRLLVQIDAWDVGSNYPTGHCVEILGAVADLETEISCLLHENELRLQPFSAAALACLPPEGKNWKIPTDEIKRRFDLRSSHRIFSVDPPGCQDIDDTMHARVLDNGDIEVGVHIADVTHFVPHNSPLDMEARIRGTTFYLVDRRFDMLPSLLSSDLCSLHGHTDRLAVSTIWTMSSNFEEIKSFWYGRTVIHNSQAMTYDQAHNILHDKLPDDESKPKPPPLTAGAPVDPSNIRDLKHDLAILTRLARKLRKDREEIGGAVDLSSGDQGSELKFTLDENNNPTRVTPKKQLEIHHTIAEMMILANEWVAKTIHDATPDHALLRIHRSVEDSRFEDLKEVLNAGNIKFDGKNNMALANSLKQAERATKSGSLMALFQSLATRAMSEAQYVCTGQAGAESGLSHYGLGLQKYTHFTSPIRRYADIVVHKQLLAAVSSENLGQPSQPFETIEQQGVVLPTSHTISILRGEGLVNEANNETVNHRVENRMPKRAPSAEAENVQCLESSFSEVTFATREETALLPYESGDVSRICENLNHRNRMAKISSFECQNLFLSLYFKKFSETAQAVVTNLKANGFWVYIPRFDLRGPVYLCDINGNLQLDPALLTMDPTSGLEPSLGFAGSGHARMFPSGRCTLVDSITGEVLEVSVAESHSRYTVRVLDVVTVKICCDNWDARARVPQPRLHLLASSPERDEPKGKKHYPTKSEKDSSSLVNPSNPEAKLDDYVLPSLYDATMKLQIQPVLSKTPLRVRTKQNTSEGRGNAVIPGRIVFGKFRNPDTLSAKQEASIAEASESATQRRNQAMSIVARTNEFESNSRIERDATARMQRLAASKRNTRKGKGK